MVAARNDENFGIVPTSELDTWRLVFSQHKDREGSELRERRRNEGNISLLVVAGFSAEVSQFCVVEDSETTFIN